MKILVLGGRGFIGRHIADAARAAGHVVTPASRCDRVGGVRCDFTVDTSLDIWHKRIAPFDAVINAVGVLRSPHVHNVHCASPAAIAEACALAHKPFLHISMLGLDQAANTPFFRSKRDGEAAIRAINSAAILLRVSLAFGADGDATRLMLLQSASPLLVLPRLTGEVAPIHVDDVAALAVCLIGTVRALGCDVVAVGTEAMSVAQYLGLLRHAGGHGKSPVMRVPNLAMRILLSITARCGARTLVPEVLDLMEHRHVGDRRHFVRWMRHPPRPVSMFLPVASDAGRLATHH
jgi:uncharacterized protein YbjT (DUF2867 family)